MADHLNEDNRALGLYERFQCVVLAWLPWDRPWRMGADEVEFAVRALETTDWGVTANEAISPLPVVGSVAGWTSDVRLKEVA